MKDYNKLMQYASQDSYDYCGRREGHYDIHELMKGLTLKHGNRIYRLKDVVFFDFTAEQVNRLKTKKVYTVVYFEVQKKVTYLKLGEKPTQKFRLYLTFNQHLDKLSHTGYRTPLSIRNKKATIPAKDFTFNSIINFSTKDIYDKGDHTW